MLSGDPMQAGFAVLLWIMAALSALTFVVVGAGPTGVELAGQIRELATFTLRDQFRRIDPEAATVLLFDGGSMPLAPFGPNLVAAFAMALLVPSGRARATPPPAPPSVPAECIRSADRARLFDR